MMRTRQQWGRGANNPNGAEHALGCEAAGLPRIVGLSNYLLNLAAFYRLAKVWAHLTPNESRTRCPNRSTLAARATGPLEVTCHDPAPAVLIGRTYLVWNRVPKLLEMDETLLAEPQPGKQARPQSNVFKCRTR